MEHVIKGRKFGHTPSRWFFKKDIAEVALILHGSTLTEERRAQIIACRDAAAEHMQELLVEKQAVVDAAVAKKRDEAQRLKDLNALYVANGIQPCPVNKHRFVHFGRALSKDYVWPDGRSAALNEITQERALEAAKEMKWYSQQIPNIKSAAREKYKPSDFKDFSSYLEAEAAGAAGRGEDALVVVLTKGLGEFEEMQSRPAEITEAMKRHRELLELGVRLPGDTPFQQLVDGKYCVSALYAANKPCIAFEVAKLAVQDALWYQNQAASEYQESPHFLSFGIGVAVDTRPEHISAAKAYVEHHGAEAVLRMGHALPDLVIKEAERGLADEFLEQVGPLAAYKALEETKNLVNYLPYGANDAFAFENVPLALTLQHSRQQLDHAVNVSLKHAGVRVIHAIKAALQVLHDVLPVAEHGLGPAIVHAVLYGEGITGLERSIILDVVANEYEDWWRKHPASDRRFFVTSIMLPRRYCPYPGCMNLLQGAAAENHFRVIHPEAPAPEHHLLTAENYAPAETTFPALPEKEAFEAFLDEICPENEFARMALRATGVGEQKENVKKRWEEWKMRVGEGPSGA